MNPAKYKPVPHELVGPYPHALYKYLEDILANLKKRNNDQFYFICNFLKGYFKGDVFGKEKKNAIIKYLQWTGKHLVAKSYDQFGQYHAFTYYLGDKTLDRKDNEYNLAKQEHLELSILCLRKYVVL